MSKELIICECGREIMKRNVKIHLRSNIHSGGKITETINKKEITDSVSIWCLRQNPYENTDQLQMKNFILDNGIITCPFAHFGEERKNVIDETYNETIGGESGRVSMSQDRKFVEEIKIGDIVVIPFRGLKECLVLKIVSEPIYDIKTNLFTTVTQNGIFIRDTGDIPFCPAVGRKVEIINSSIKFRNKRFLGKHSLCRIDYDKFNNEKI